MVGALLTASRVLVAVSARSLAAVEETLTVPQFRTLVVLEAAGPTSLSGLAEQLAVNPSTAMRMVDRLVAMGLVGRTADPGDRRVTRIAATAEGRRIVREVTERRQAEITRIVSAMPAEHQEALVEALQSFADAAAESPVAPETYATLSLPGWT
jgi:DNA-binding MarR family transcriptional regulator